MTDQHQHNYSQLTLIPVKADAPKTRRKQFDFAGYGVDLPHLGTVLPMAILAWKCECKKVSAFEYGTRKAMAELGRRMKDEK